VSYRFDDEVLIVDSQTGRIHVLNPVAAIVWECFDGTVTLDELAPELAEVFNAPVEVVLADIVAMARQLGDLGLLTGVTSFVPVAPSMPGVREVGETIGPLQLLTSDGDAVTVPHPDSKATLLVNWSPSCGYCIKIVDELEQCRPGLAEQGVELVLLTVGSDEDNRRILDPAGLSDAAYYRSRDEDGNPDPSSSPFGSLGTPVAYLLDADGRIDTPLAMGAAEVPSLARRAAGLPEPTAEITHPLPPEDGAEHVHVPARPSLPAAGGMCGPSSQSSTKAPRQWASTVSFGIGEYQVGVRADSSRTEDLLARAFAPYLIDDGAQVAPNFSVVLGGSGTGDAKALSLLLAADTTVVRSRSPRRVITALQARMSALVSSADNDGLLRTTSLGALVGDQAILLPQGVIRWIEHLQPRLARLGVRLSDQPGALVDPLSGELVVPEPAIDVPPDVLSELGELRSSRSELPPVEPGRYKLGAWGFDEAHSSEIGQLSTAGSIAALLPAVEGSPDRLGEVIQQLESVIQRCTIVPLCSTSERELMESIEGRLTAS
jgi:hypothetical protein